MSRARGLAAAVAAAVAAAALAGCGTATSDLFIVQRAGKLPSASLTLVVKDGPQVTCNGKEREMTSAQVLRARELSRDLAPLFKKTVRLRRGADSQLLITATGEDGTVSFYDSSPGLTPEMARLLQFTRDVARGACRLPR